MLDFAAFPGTRGRAARSHFHVARDRRCILRFSDLLPALVGLVLLSQAPCAAAADVRADIARKLNIKVEDVRPAPFPGMFEVSNGAEIAYVSADGQFYLDGDLYDMDSKENLTERRRAGAREQLLAAVQDADGILFGPADAKYKVDVFTDIDCGYCRKLHTEIAELNRLGVRVRYLMFPRSGPGTESWRKAEAVMCSKDRGEALTRAKRGEAIPSQSCRNPVERTYRLAQDLGVTGTPGILTERGDLIPGYQPAPRLVERIKRLYDAR
jgi:thiol:disulfide interchange protein DsbC